MKKIAVLISGNGSNLQAIIDAINSHKITNAKIALVISSSEKAYGLIRAKENNIDTLVISKKTFANPNDEILKELVKYEIDLVVLAGYLGIIQGKILNVYKNKIINIHPALLPKFGGPGMYGHHVHEAVIKAKEKYSGATVHYVNENVDGGKIIIQESIPVLANDSAESLAKRVLEIEHKILPIAINKVIV